MKKSIDIRHVSWLHHVRNVNYGCVGVIINEAMYNEAKFLMAIKINRLIIRRLGAEPPKLMRPRT